MYNNDILAMTHRINADVEERENQKKLCLLLAKR
jgi:hypothetical protein